MKNNDLLRVIPYGYRVDTHTHIQTLTELLGLLYEEYFI